LHFKVTNWRQFRLPVLSMIHFFLAVLLTKTTLAKDNNSVKKCPFAMLNFFFRCRWDQCTVKKGLGVFPGYHLPNSPWPGIIYPAPGRLVKKIPESRNFFYSVVSILTSIEIDLSPAKTSSCITRIFIKLRKSTCRSWWICIA